MWSFTANAREYCTNVNFIMETNAQYNMNGVCNTIPLLQFALDGRERYIQYAYGFFSLSLYIQSYHFITSINIQITMSNIVAPFVATQATILSTILYVWICTLQWVCVCWWQSQKDENFCFLSTSSWWHYVVINGRIPSPELKVRREMMNNKAISTFSKKQINSQREWHVCTNIKLVCWWKSVRTSISKKRKKYST